jgi:two-component system NtrC family response regulator
MVEAGQFREDLLFRLRSFTINLPALRDRQGDIRKLTVHHMGKICERYGVGLKGYSADFMEALVAYPWPGNVRELFHAVERAMAAAQFEPTLFARHLPDEIRIHFTKTALSGRPPSRAVVERGDARHGELPPFKSYKHEMESRYLRELISVSGGYIKEACRISGLSRSYLYELLKHYEISVPRGQAPPESK